MAAKQALAPNDWLEHPELLPPRPQTLTEGKYTRHFAVDVHGRKYHDQFVFLAPNGVAVIGLAPSHPLVAAHRRATGFKPLPFKYIPPNLDHLKAEELAAAAQDEDAPEDSLGGPAVAAASDADGTAPSGRGAAPRPETEALLDASPAQAPVNGEVAAEGPEAEAPAGGTGGDASPSDGQQQPGRGPKQSEKAGNEPFPPEDCSRVNFEAGAARHMAGTKMSGKKRNRANTVRGTSLLAQVERRGGGRSFPASCLLNGQLLEVNERLTKAPRLLFERPCREGYLALLMPTADGLTHMRTKLLSEADYLKLRGLTAEDLL